MQANELCSWMSSHHSTSGVLQTLIRRDVLSVAGPVRVDLQLSITFIEAVDRLEEGFGLGCVYRHRHAQRPAYRPHRVETLVVDRYERSGLNIFAKAQT